MTAQMEEKSGPIWFFTSRDNAMLQQLGRGHRAIAAFSSKNHELFASIKGNLSVDNDRTVIERLWNPFSTERTTPGSSCCDWTPNMPRYG